MVSSSLAPPSSSLYAVSSSTVTDNNNGRHTWLTFIFVKRTYAIGVARSNMQYFLASESADAHYEYCALLETYPLFGTPFEEAALWSLFIITATANPRLWKRSTFNILREWRLTVNNPSARTDMT